MNHIQIRYSIDAQNNKSSSSLYCTHKFLSMYCDSSNGILKIKSVQVNFVVDTVVLLLYLLRNLLEQTLGLVVAVKCTKCISMITNHVSFEKQNKVQCMCSLVCSTSPVCVLLAIALPWNIVSFALQFYHLSKCASKSCRLRFFKNNSKAFMTTLKMLFSKTVEEKGYSTPYQISR